MRIKTWLKRIISTILAALFFISVAQPMVVLANDQLPVTTFEMNNTTAPGSRNYSLHMSWTRPPAAAMPVNPPVFPNWIFTGPMPWSGHRATGYNIVRRHAAAASNPWIQVGTQPNPAVAGDSILNHTHVNNSLPLAQRMQDGRFYAFRIDSFHWHNFAWVGPGTPGPGDVNPSGRVPPVGAGTEFGQPGQDELYFMTDLVITAEGLGNELTVRWSRPVLYGADPFEGYRIHFAPGGHGVGNIFNQAFAVVPTNHPDLIIDGDFYEFTIIDPNLVGGAMYAVAVEPFIGNATRRTSPSLSDVFFDQEGLVLRYTMNEYRNNNAFVRPIFTYTPVGLNLIQLSWGRPDQASRVQLHHRAASDAIWIPLGELSGPAARLINFWVVNRPTGVHQFRLTIHVPDNGGYTEEVLYLDFDPSITPFTPTRPDILHIDHSPPGDAPQPPITLDITWEAFSRLPYLATEGPGNANHVNGRFFDPQIVYEIAISDSLETLAGLNATNPAHGVVTLSPGDLQRIQFTPEGSTTTFWAHEYSFESFFCSVNEEVRPILPNMVYYVRIITRRVAVPAPRGVNVSLPSFASHFVPGVVEVRPPTVPVPPLRVHEETEDSITIRWERIWFEGFYDGQWQAIAIRAGNTLVFGREILETDWRFENQGGATTWAGANNHPAWGSIPRVPIRMQRLAPHVGYELHVVPYVDIADDIALIPGDDVENPHANFEEFATELHGNPAAWTVITPDLLDNNNTLEFEIAGLNSNTTYAIFFRPFNPSPQAEARNAWWPSFLVGTTQAAQYPIEIEPTVPILWPYQAGDTWLWFNLRPYSPPVTHEFRISEFPDFETSWVFNETPGIQFNDPASGQPSRRFGATLLFPDTTYYIWARAIGIDAEGNPVPGRWSNPITMRTAPLRTPLPPRGLGIASAGNVNIINMENETQFAPIDHDSMIITWMPKPGDDNLPIEMQDGAMGTEILGSPQITHAYLVRFPELLANRAYYVRARTILSVHREGVGEPASRDTFNYIVQMATNPEFLDAITVFVLPEASEITNDFNTRMTMSEWTQTFIFHTGRDTGEYDSDVIAELFPLPDRDFEIIYNPATRTLTFRFRSTGVDAQGHRDNLVDQRFISRLIQTRTFDYVIDMTHYNNLPVANRIVELPYSIITAFEERQISLSVIAGGTTYSLSPGFAATPQNTGFNMASRLRLYISDVAVANLPTLRYGQRYMSVPQNVAINVVNPTSRTELSLLGAPLNVSHSINRAAMMDFNIGSYVRSADDVNWRRIESSFNDVAGTLNSSATRLQDFAAVGTGVPTQWAALDPAVRDALYFVNSQIAFTDMDWFMADAPINAWQINRMISAIARRSTTIAINQDLSPEEVTSLTNAGMLVPGAAEVTRQNALSALVRLYEVRTGRRVVGHPSLANSAFIDIVTAGANMQDAMLRAEFLGFIDHASEFANPHGHMTMGDAMLIFEIILRN